jgi:hypothetical protein
MYIKVCNYDFSELDKIYNELVDETHQLYYEAPQTSDKAVKLAKTALEKTQDNNFTDEEVDRYLPPLLKRGNYK